MILALIRKEWEKSRITILAGSIFILFFLIKIYFEISNKLEHNNPSTILLSIIQMQNIEVTYFFMTISLFGIFLAISQYRPEKEDAKVRLHLHLPLKRTILINFIIFYGIAVIFIITVISNMIFFIIITNFFPIEIFYAFESNLISYFCIAIISYLALGIIIIHPLMIVKISILLLTYAINTSYFYDTAIFFSGENMYYYFIFICISYYFSFIRSFEIYTQGYTK